MTVQQNQKVSDFSIQNQDNKSITLSELSSRQIVLYFYPKDHTPGCTTESGDFRDLHAQFLAANTLVFGISRDNIASHERFKNKLELPFDLLSDTDETLCQLFDVIKMKNLYGKQHLGIERSTFLIDDQGVLRQQWRKVKVKDHAAEVLAAAKALQG